MKIILIGFMGAGKSSVAKELGSILKWPVLEMDNLAMEKTHSKSIHEVFDKGGEILLRQTEILLAQEYASIENHVISTGAGIVLNKITLDYLKKRDDIIFFLNADFKTISKRLSNDSSRPLFKNTRQAKSLYQFRQPLYLKYADHVVDVNNKSIEDVAQEIVQKSFRG